MLALFIITFVFGPRAASGQPAAGGDRPVLPTLSLSLAEAVEAALRRSYAIRLARVDRRVADQQIREAYSALFPRIDANASYERTFLLPNPFAGSDAAALFSGVNASDWLAYNERVRLGREGLASPEEINAACPGVMVGPDVIPFSTYAACLAAAQAGARRGDPLSPDDNPFLVENNVVAGLSLDQLLYSGAAFAGVRAAERAQGASEAQLRRVGQRVARDVTAAYYRVLLARASVEVVEASVGRTRLTVEEVSSRVREGVVPQFQQLSAEVELANLETQLVTARDQAATAADALAFIIGVPVDTQLVLTDQLRMPVPAPVVVSSLDEAMTLALKARPDIEAAQLTVELRQAAEEVTTARYFPELRLVANLAAVGNIPDDRERVVGDISGDVTVLPTNPFLFRSEERGIFDSSFWGTNLTAGINLTWNLFEGFATAARLEQDQLETRRARIQLEQLVESIRQEVAAERRNVASALERVAVQERNVERAELNYRHAELRVKEGVSTQLELREASQQLDESQFNRLQAVHDYLVAEVSYLVAVGRPPFVERGQDGPDD